LAARVPGGTRECVSGQWEAALVRRTGCRAGAQDRAAGAGDRFFEGLLAAHRRTADAAGIDWESAVFRKISEEVKMDRGLTMKRMVKLAQVSRASYYRFDEEASAYQDPDMDLRDAIQRIDSNGPATGGRVSRRS